MPKHYDWRNPLYRKLAAASIVSLLTALLLSLLPYPAGLVFFNPSESDIRVPASLIQRAGFFLLFAAPVVFLYGTACSLLADAGGSILRLRGGSWGEPFVSLLLHAAFGLILLWMSLLPALLFFAADRLLRLRRGAYRLMHALAAMGGAAPLYAISLLFWAAR